MARFGYLAVAAGIPALLVAVGACGKLSDVTATGDDAGSDHDDAPRSEGSDHNDAGSGRDARVPAPPNPRAHPRFAALPDNTALDLGQYTCADRMPQIKDYCQSIFDFSRINYDPFNHRLLVFGGGHSATGRTDIDTFNLETLKWESLYPSMSCADVSEGDIDPSGFHRATGHPAARHTYDLNVIAKVNGVGRFLMLSHAHGRGTCHPYESPSGAIPFLDLTPGNTTWKYGEAYEQGSPPWAYFAAGEFDPVSGMVIVLGGDRGAGPGGFYVFDPRTMALAVFAPRSTSLQTGNTYQSNLVYFPPNERMYHISRLDGAGVRNTVLELTLDRSSWASSTSLQVEVTGTPPTGQGGFAYDSHAQRIGGAAAEAGRFYTFDPTTKTWESEVMNIDSADGTVPGKQYFHNLDYDPINNVYFLITSQGDTTYRLWAYRYRN